MKKITLITAAIIIATNLAFSQGTSINSTGATADSSAMLDVSDTTKGILIPRMKKTNKLAITSPATGLMVYQTDDTTGFWYYNGAKWMQAIGPAGPAGASSSCFNPLYPDGFSSITPVSMKNLSTSNYTVPAGKNLYITGLFAREYTALFINSKTITEGWWNYPYDQNCSILSMPIIAGENDVISANNDIVAINGFLIDAVVSPETMNNLNTTPYTVPAGKTFIITNLYSHVGYILYIDGIQFSKLRWNSPQTSDYDKYVLKSPLIVSSGSVISTNNDADLTVNGYLY